MSESPETPIEPSKEEPGPGDGANGRTEPQSEQASASKRPDLLKYEKNTKYRLPLGLCGVLLWLFLFSIGVLIPSEQSRKNLGWDPDSTKDEDSRKLEQRIAILEGKQKGETKDPNAQPPAVPPPGTNNPVSADTAIPRQTTGGPNPPHTTKSSPNDNTPKAGDDARKHGTFKDFIVATFTFTPLNVGFLCVLAAFIGGCSINNNEILRIQQEIHDLEAKPPITPNPEIMRLRLRLDYLTEHPGYSTIRGLVVYLIIISGLFIIGAPMTGEDGNQFVSLGQYMKLAGLFSFFGYLSGYDPTVFSSVIGFGTKQLNPGPAKP